MLPALLFTALLAGCASAPGGGQEGGSAPSSDAGAPTLGTPEWQTWVDRKIGSGDGQGHGPDVGSSEWCSTIDFRLFGGASGLPPCSPLWNQRVHHMLTGE